MRTSEESIRFRRLLLGYLSPHRSRHAFKHWLEHVHVFDNPRSRGLYATGGSRYPRHALRALAGSPVFYAALLLCASYWRPRILLRRLRPGKPLARPVLLSPLLCKLVISQERALDGPKNRHARIEGNCRTAAAAACETRSRAVWHYMIDTLDPVAQQTHIGRDNLYYHVRLVGCAIASISPLGSIPCSPNRAPWTISTLTPMEIAEVLARFSLATLTIAALMDSMD